MTTTLTVTITAPNPSTRLHDALAAGTRPDPAHATLLVERCAVEPDFFVRDMLTWALTRRPAARRCTPCRRSGTPPPGRP